MSWTVNKRLLEWGNIAQYSILQREWPQLQYTKMWQKYVEKWWLRQPNMFTQLIKLLSEILLFKFYDQRQYNNDRLTAFDPGQPG